MSIRKAALLVVACYGGLVAALVSAQGITIPNSFTNGTVADATEVNANFAALSSDALNRTGGTMTGTLNSLDVKPTTDAARDLGTASLQYRNLYLSGGTYLAGILQPSANLVATTTSTGNQDDFNFSGASLLRANNATQLIIRGLAAGIGGQRLTIVSVGAGHVGLSNQDTNSAAANRIIGGFTGIVPLAAGSGRVTLQYDATTARWRVIAHEQGTWIDPAASAGNFTASGAMTWTVGGGDIALFRYHVIGSTMTVGFEIDTSSVGGVVSTDLNMAAAGFLTATAAHSVSNTVAIRDNGGTRTGGVAIASGANIAVQKIDGTNWTASADTTQVLGEITFDLN